MSKSEQSTVQAPSNTS